MEKINIVELLKDCPKGMELDCTMYNKVTLLNVDRKDICFPIRVKREDGNSITLTKYGQYTDADFAKCVIFPTGKTTWEGFVPPCKFKDGDIIFTHADCLKVGLGNSWISIFKEKRNGGVATYVDYAENGSDYYSDLDGDKALLCMESDILRQRFATEEEKQKLFDAIKANGYKWNTETKTLEKLVKPKFKVGDRIRHKNDKTIIKTINYIYNHNDSYGLWDGHLLFFNEQDEYELVPNKFDINTLVPFESKVLVRDNDVERWRPTFWGFYDNDDELNYPYECVGDAFAQCIPYEGNEHLIGTNNKCNDFYKTWK